MTRFALLIVAAVFGNPGSGITTEINSGEIWNDTDGRPIQAHGGGILFHEGVYYWYGENKAGPTVKHYSPENPKHPVFRVDVIGISCYSSPDLLNWKNEGVVLPAVKGDPNHDLHPSKVAERPKVLYNSKTGKFVMWIHMDSNDYKHASAGVAVADKPTGPFTYLKSFRPIDGETYRDMNLFLDDDGKAYVFYASEGNATLYISRLNDDFTDIVRPPVENKTWAKAFRNKSREAPAPFKHRGKYYLLTSGCTGWNPNPVKYALADQILGPWQNMGNAFSKNVEKDSWHSQSTFVLPVAGKPDCYIYMGDRWIRNNLRDSRYIWLPFMIGKEGQITINPRKSWNLQIFDNPERVQRADTDTNLLIPKTKSKAKAKSNLSVHSEYSNP